MQTLSGSQDMHAVCLGNGLQLICDPGFLEMPYGLEAWVKGWQDGK